MGEPLEVPVQALYTHASSVDRAADAADTARAAAAVTHLDRSAYGVMCQFMPEYFEPGMGQTVDGLAGCVRELRAIAGGLRAAANAYDRADTNAANRQANVPTIRLPL